MYPGKDDPERWVLGPVLLHQARTRPNAVFVKMVDGGSLTFAEAEEESARVATYVSSIGVGPGDRVAVLLNSSLDLIRVWLGLGRLGAVFVALNTEIKGSFLTHQLRNSGARVAVTSPSLLETLTSMAGEFDSLTVAVADARAKPGKNCPAGGGSAASTSGRTPGGSTGRGYAPATLPPSCIRPGRQAHRRAC